jgi:gliding motility-associated-like protein
MPTMRKITISLVLVIWISLIADAQNIIVTGNRCVEANLTFSLQTSNTPDSYAWDCGDGFTSTASNPVHQFTSSGTYTVEVSTMLNGVSSSLSINITILDNPDVGFTVDTILHTSYARTFTDTTKSDFLPLSYSWNFNDQSERLTTNNVQVYHKFPSAGVFNVVLTVTDNNKCVDSVSHSVTTYDLFIVPNVFTPNNDGQNDNFIVTSNGIVRFSIEIFNRWGNRVFRRTDVEQIVWDGFNPEGTLVSPGTYFYVITPGDGTGTYEPLNGYITIFY